MFRYTFSFLFEISLITEDIPFSRSHSTFILTYLKKNSIQYQALTLQDMDASDI